MSVNIETIEAYRAKCRRCLWHGLPRAVKAQADHDADQHLEWHRRNPEPITMIPYV